MDDSMLRQVADCSFGHEMRQFWRLEPGMHFLNHGSFGATPRYVLAAQEAWRARMEVQPVRFMTSELPLALRAAAARLGDFLGCADERIAWVDNATTAINAVLRSFPWRTGDEIVVADHAYLAVRHTVDFVARRYGLRIKTARIPFPSLHEDAVLQAYCAAIGAQTRLAIVDHIFSPLALVAPLAKIAAHCKSLGVAVLADGAHAPGAIPLQLDTLGALGVDWYVGNCHKWMLSPKGCAFLYATPEAAVELHPATISNFFGEGMASEFDWQGTRDCSAWLATTAALEFLQAIGVERYRDYLKNLANEAARCLCDGWRVALPAAENQFAAMATVPLPSSLSGEATPAGAARLHDRLWEAYRIEVPVLAFDDRLWLRISAQIYNELADYAALMRAIREIGG